MKPTFFQNKFTFKDFQTTAAVVLAGVILLMGLTTLNWWLASQYGFGEDFLPAWHGSRAFLFEQTDPYSRTVAERTQVVVYGQAANSVEYPFALDIPFPLLILLFPFAIIPDPIWARAIWMSLSEVGLLLLVPSVLRLADWHPKRWFQFLLLAFSLTWYYSVSAILSGSYSILLALALLTALKAMRDFNDEAAGVLLAISTLRWEVTLLLWLFIFISASFARRTRVFAGFVMTWVVLGASAFIIHPSWVWPYMRAVAANWRAEDVLTPMLFMSKWLPEYGARLLSLLIAILLLVLILEWFSALRGRDFRRVAWAAAFSISVTPLLGFSTTLGDLAPLVFSFVFILPFAWERWKKRPYLVITVIILLVFGLPLLLIWPTIASRVPAEGLNFLMPPLLVILGLYWIRWTVVRPPRTWLDEAKRGLGK